MSIASTKKRPSHPATPQLIDTAVVPAGGYGTRFLPATKSVPKEMFPLGNKPVVLRVVEELAASGVKKIIFIVSPYKHSLENLFSPNEPLEDYYLKIGKDDRVRELRQIARLAEFTFVYTRQPYGNGGCLHAARHLLHDRPFVLVWADEIIVANGRPRVRQCLDAYEKYGLPVISTVRIPEPEDRARYGMAELAPFKKENNIRRIVSLVEKPPVGREPSEYASHGAYVLTPEIFNALDKTRPRADGDLWLVDVINTYRKNRELLACLIDGDYYDCGHPVLYLKSQLDYALKHEPHAREIRKFILRRAQGAAE